MVTIFRLTWSHARGVYWLAMRNAREQDAEAWLDVFRRDEPGAEYIAAKRAPKIKTGDESRALHVAR